MTITVSHWEYGPADRSNAHITTTEIYWFKDCKEQRGVVIGHDREDNGEWVAIVRIENTKGTAMLDRVPFSEIVTAIQSHYRV